MEDADARTGVDRPTIGLLGDPQPVRSRIADRQVVEGSADVAAGEPTVIVAVGEAGVGERLRIETGAPMLPVDIGAGLPGVSADGLPAALDAILDGRADRVERPVLAVAIDGHGRDRALFDVTLVSERPAHISEFRVSRADSSVLETRSDGVVLATPAGSHGYAHAAGGVRLATGTEALSLVPISGFATGDERWVTPIEPLTVSVQREETPVEVRADDRVLGTVTGGATVTIEPAGTLTTVVPSATGSSME